MTKYKLHCFCQSGNSYKVALYLNCVGLEWEPVFVDFMNGATRDPKWRASVNEMGEAPVLEMDNKRLTQSGAILVHLADLTGKFAPQTTSEHDEVLRWIRVLSAASAEHAAALFAEGIEPEDLEWDIRFDLGDLCGSRDVPIVAAC